jgi:hypothetical protein
MIYDFFKHLILGFIYRDIPSIGPDTLTITMPYQVYLGSNAKNVGGYYNILDWENINPEHYIDKPINLVGQGKYIIKGVIDGGWSMYNRVNLVKTNDRFYRTLPKIQTYNIIHEDQRKNNTF